MLLYTSKGVTGTSHFRIRGLLPLRGMLVSARHRAGGRYYPSSCSSPPAVPLGACPSLDGTMGDPSWVLREWG